MMIQVIQLHVGELCSGIRRLHIEGCTWEVSMKNLCNGVSQLYRMNLFGPKNILFGWLYGYKFVDDHSKRWVYNKYKYILIYVFANCYLFVGHITSDKIICWTIIFIHPSIIGKQDAHLYKTRYVSKIQQVHWTLHGMIITLLLFVYSK